MGIFASLRSAGRVLFPGQEQPQPSQLDSGPTGKSGARPSGFIQKLTGQPGGLMGKLADQPGGWMEGLSNGLRGMAQGVSQTLGNQTPSNRLDQTNPRPFWTSSRRPQLSGLAQVRQNAASRYPTSQLRPPEAMGPMGQLRRI